MESWPITIDDVTFSLTREGNFVKQVVVTFSNIRVDQAPTIEEGDSGGNLPTITIPASGCLQSARQKVLSWQTVVSGLQIYDIDFDSHDLRFHPETIAEEDKVAISHFRGSTADLSAAYDFEQIGRAFCAGAIPSDRIESTSHYRDGRLAFQAGRNIDAYNNMFLFLESRYCNGKTEAKQQVSLLLKSIPFTRALKNNISDQKARTAYRSKHLDAIFAPNTPLIDQVKHIVKLRGRLRHHSLKSPHRWDPNNQAEYQPPARFLSALVSDIIIEESLADIYAPANLEAFRELSVKSGFETKLMVKTHRQKKESTLQAEMSFPTTVISSHICRTALLRTLQLCRESGQLEDTTKLDATSQSDGLELFVTELGIWAYTETQNIILPKGEGILTCEFEHFKMQRIVKDRFTIGLKMSEVNILASWTYLKRCLDHIEEVDPTTRIMCLKLSIGNQSRPILNYRVGSQVLN